MKRNIGWFGHGTIALALLSGCATAPENSNGSASPGTPVTEVYTLGDVEMPPKATKTVRPQYPFTLADRHINAIVVLDVVVLGDGTVGDVKVESSTNKEFNYSAVDAVRHTRYLPAMLAGKPVACRLQVTIEYNKPKQK